MRELFLTCLVVAALAVWAFWGLSGGAEKAIGRPSLSLIAGTCTTCHGENGLSPGSIPTLSGFRAREIERRLIEFKSGERPSTMMRRIMAPFEKDDIRALAEYFAALKAPERCGEGQ